VLKDRHLDGDGLDLKYTEDARWALLKTVTPLLSSCAFQIVKQDDAWVVLIGLEFNDDEMTWTPMPMWFYTEDAAF